MNATTGRMSPAARRRHHAGWLRVFRFMGGVEIWVGDRWASVTW